MKRYVSLGMAIQLMSMTLPVHVYLPENSEVCTRFAKSTDSPNDVFSIIARDAVDGFYASNSNYHGKNEIYFSVFCSFFYQSGNYIYTPKSPILITDSLTHITYGIDLSGVEYLIELKDSMNNHLDKIITRVDLLTAHQKNLFDIAKG